MKIAYVLHPPCYLQYKIFEVFQMYLKNWGVSVWILISENLIFVFYIGVIENDINSEWVNLQFDLQHQIAQLIASALY